MTGIIIGGEIVASGTADEICGCEESKCRIHLKMFYPIENTKEAHREKTIDVEKK